MGAENFHYNYVILSLAGLPECKNDDDTELISAMEAKIDKEFQGYEARAAGVKPFDLFIISGLDEKAKAEYWEEQGYKDLEAPETECSKIDFIESWLHKLQKVDKNTLPLHKRRLFRQFLKFLERKKTLITI